MAFSGVTGTLVRKDRPYSKPKKGRAFLYKGQIPMRILDNGALDLSYVPPLRDLLRMEGSFVVELAELKALPLKEFQDEELRDAAIRSREQNIQLIRNLIKKRRMMDV